MSLRSVNLNLVPILLALLRTRSVSSAASQLGLSQGAASNALSRLRATFDDPLLVRVGAHMELTPRAVDLIAPTETLCAELETYFSRPRFDPSKVERTFVIAASDYVTVLMAGPILAAVCNVAPQARLRFVDVVDRVTERMTEREIDLAIFPKPFLNYLAPARFNSRPLLNEVSVAVFRTGHPLSRFDTLNEEDLAPYRAITFHPSSETVERQDPNAFMGGYAFDVAAFVPQVATAPFLLLDNDYFSIVPKRIADRLAKILPIEIRPLTFNSGVLEIVIAWSPVRDRDPAHIWLRDIVRRHAAMNNDEPGPAVRLASATG